MTTLNSNGILGQRLLTPAEAAAELGCTVDTLKVWRSTGRHGDRLPYLKIGHKVRYRVDDVKAFLDSCRRTHTE